MKQFMQTIRLGLMLSLILTSFSVKAETSETTPDVKYKRWYYSHEGKHITAFCPLPRLKNSLTLPG